MDRQRILKGFFFVANHLRHGHLRPSIFINSKYHTDYQKIPDGLFHPQLFSTFGATKNGRNQVELATEKYVDVPQKPIRNFGNRENKFDRKRPARKNKFGTNNRRKPSAECTSMEDFFIGETNLIGEQESEDEKGLPDWVEVPPHCASDVQVICTLLSDEFEQNRNINSILRKFRSKLTSDIVLGVLRNYKRIGKERTMQFFSWSGQQSRYEHDNAVVDYMADFLGRRKLFDDLKCLLKTMSRRIDCVTPRTVSIAVRFLGRAGRVDEALGLFEGMEKEFNCKPNNLAFNNLLYVLCKSPSVSEQQMVAYVEKALSIFRKMDCPDTYSYSNIIVGLCKVGRVEKALTIFKEMQGNGVVPTKTAVNNIIGELCEANKKEVYVENVQVEGSSTPFNILIPNLRKKNYLDPVMEIFYKVGALGLFPSVFATNMLIDELCRSGEVEEALKIFRLTDERGLRRDEQTHNIILQAMCKVGRIEEACGIFSKMISEGLKPKIIVYNFIISALCQSGNLKEAENYFVGMKKKHCLPNNVTYTALIHGHCKAENWQAASTLLDELLGLGWSPHSHTFSLVDSLLKKAGKYELSKKLLHKMETQLIHNDCKAGKWETAHQKLNKMVERGFSPQAYTLDLVEQALRKAGKWGMVRELMQKVQRVATK
eukprot:Gb_00054 [translate_table: standard]